jgi:uncharacterized Fe-S cluster protein YjdI
MSNKITEAELNELKNGGETHRVYTEGDLTVYWRPKLCIHSANCLIGLPQVFRSGQRPWVNMQSAPGSEIEKVVDTCPSRALTYLRNDELPSKPGNSGTTNPDSPVKVQILRNGPALIRGNYVITGHDGTTLQAPSEVAAICRCGESKKKPFCDGTHHKTGFTD